MDDRDRPGLGTIGAIVGAIGIVCVVALIFMGGKVADLDARPPELLIIRTGSLEIEVADIGDSVASADEAIGGLGGYVGSSEENASGTDGSASVVYRVPASRWEEATAKVRDLA